MAKFNVGEQFQDRQQVSDGFLLREAAHRYKNLLSVVRAIARQTGNFYTDLDQFKGALDSRLMALSESHDLMLSGLESTSLLELIRAQLNVVIGVDDLGLIEINGPEIQLRPAFTQSMGIAIYELAVNSIKHGALHRKEGNVRISWNVSTDKKNFVFIWQENGNHGNEVEKKGFGHMVLEHITPESAGGTADLFISPVGVSWVLKALLSGVAVAAPN